MRRLARLVRRTADLSVPPVMLALALLVAAIVGITLAAVWWRYVLNSPLSWTEQLSRILFVWVTFLGAAVLYRRGLHIAVDLLVEALPQRLRNVFRWIQDLAMLIIILILLYYGWQLSVGNLRQTFGALNITPSTFYFSAPVSAGLMLLYWFERAFERLGLLEPLPPPAPPA